MFSAFRASPPARMRDLVRDLVGHARVERLRAAAHHIAKRLERVRLELVDLGAREQRRVHLEVGVLGRRADQRHEAFLDAGQQRVLLRLVEAVDLVQEEDRPLALCAEPLAGAGEHLADVRHRRLDGRELLERGARRLGDDPRERRLSRAGRPVEDHRRDAILLDREAERAARADDVLLAREVLERGRPQALRKRRGRAEPAPGGLAEEVGHDLSMLFEMSEVWSEGTYENLAARFAPVQDQLVEVLRIAAGDEVLDLATGTGEVALRAAQARRAASPPSTSPSRCSRRRASGPSEEGLEIAFERGDAEYLAFDDASFDVVSSNFGLIFAPDHANVASELARLVRPGGRVGFTAWKPNPKLGELYRSFTEEPIEGRESYEWGREDHVEDMLGEDFELEFEDGTLWLEAENAEEIWTLFSESAPPIIALIKRLDAEQQEGVPSRVRRALRELRDAGRDSRAPPVPARPRNAQVSETAELLQRLIRLDTTNPPGNETLAAELLREYLEAAGVECELYARSPERANLVARIRGRGDGPSLAFLSHTDVVLADRGRVGARPVRRRARRRRRLGPRRARHEGRGRGIGGRAGDARA